VIVPSGSRTTTFLTYIGTPGDDRVTGVATDGNVFAVVGTTNSSGLTGATAAIYQPFQTSPAGGIDGFFILGSASGGNSVYFYGSTYLGDWGDDTPNSVLIDGKTYYIAGETTSPDFPLAGEFPSVRRGSSDAFVLKIATIDGAW